MSLSTHVSIWRFPKIGVPQVTIHFRLGFSMNETIYWGTPMTMETSISTNQATAAPRCRPPSGLASLASAGHCTEVASNGIRGGFKGTSNKNLCGFHMDHIYSLIHIYTSQYFGDYHRSLPLDATPLPPRKNG
jgi:hypothetical protein